MILFGNAVILLYVVGGAVRTHSEAGAPACEGQAAGLCEWRVSSSSTALESSYMTR